MGEALGISWDNARGSRACRFLARPMAAVLALSLLAPALFNGPARRVPTAVELPWLTSVIVRATAATVADVEDRVHALGGTVSRQLQLIDGFSADVPVDAIDRIASVPGVQAVTPDGPVRLLAAATGSGSGPASKGTSMFAATVTTGAQQLWSAGYTGAGVDIAVIDSGIAPVAGLDTDGKLVRGADFSDPASPAADLADGYGHGTHMAGIIAGRDRGATAPYAGDSTDFVGMAPDARLVDVKVADAEGTTDISKLIAGIDWVVQHRQSDGFNIRVLNLSFGVPSNQGYETDPLAYAAEAAWRSGIVVVAAAGNAGSIAGKLAPGLTSPAYDPFVVAVGAADSNGTADRRDDTVAGFSSSSSGGERRPDLVAPGRSVQSLLAPGSAVDVNTTPGNSTRRFVNGSGTSQAAAVVSGAAALMVNRWPGATPDQIKAVLMRSTSKVPGANDDAQGKGQLDLADALRIKDLPKAEQRWTPSDGSGWGSADGSIGNVGGGSDFSKGGGAYTDKMAKDAARAAKEAAKGAAKAAARAAKAAAEGGVAVEEPGQSSSGHSWSGHSWSGNSWSGHSWSSAGWSDGDWN